MASRPMFRVLAMRRMLVALSSQLATKQAMSEMILPQYRELLNRYFYALAQHKDEADGGK